MSELILLKVLFENRINEQEQDNTEYDAYILETAILRGNEKQACFEGAR